MIYCNVTGRKYIGSTTKDRVAQRLAEHVRNYKHYQNGSRKGYTSSFEILAGGNYIIELIELYPCSYRDDRGGRCKLLGVRGVNLDCYNYTYVYRTLSKILGARHY